MGTLPNIPLESPKHDHKSICVIGCGSSGLAALKVVLDTPQFKSGLWNIVAFESRQNVGGIWLPALPTDDPPLTPLYDSMTANLPHPIMAYTSFPFPPSTPVFPKASVVQSYLEAYRDHFQLSPYIRLNTTVKDVRWVKPLWEVNLSTNQTLSFDFLIVASGHHRVPIYPPIPGLSKWLQEGRASHSAWYRGPRDLGNIVLVVGDGPSGTDVVFEMRSVSQTVIHANPSACPGDVGNLKTRGRVVEFKDHNNQVVFEDGTVESGISHCILATGYSFSFPFFSSSIIQSHAPVPPLPKQLYNSDYHIFPLAKHLFPLQAQFPPSSMAFLGSLTKGAAFPYFEAMAHAIVKVFSEPESLDLTREAADIMQRYELLRARYGDDEVAIAKAWHRLIDHESFEYRDQLWAFVGIDLKVQEWEKEMYDEKFGLRDVWRELENSGEASEWVKGVGEGGEEEWIQLLNRMVKRLKGVEDQPKH